jgi:mycothiol synthase
MTEISGLTSRPWAGPDDLRAMKAIVSAAWQGAGRSFVGCTVGDLEWWLASGGPEVDWSSRIRIWAIGGEPVAWGWINPPAALDWFVRHGLPPAAERAVRIDILTWLAGVARASATDGDQHAPIDIEVWAGDGWPEAELLAELGWTTTDVALSQYQQPLDLDLDPPRVPEGYTLRSLRGPADIPARVEVHRAAFAPSKMTTAKYEILVRQDHYAYERDIVLEAADGSFAAFAMCWMDPAGSIGEFEPVGVHPDHQRRGLGRVIMRHGLRLMRAAGLRDALVFSLRSNAASEALYQSAGFRTIAVHRRYSRSLER